MPDTDSQPLEGPRTAVYSLVLGVLSFAGPGLILSGPAIALGHGARRKIRRGEMTPRAKVYATLGLVLGYLNVALCVGLMAYVLVLYYQLVVQSTTLPVR